MATNTGDDRRSEELETNVKEGISVIVEFCLRRLVEMGQVSKEQLKHRVRIDWNSSRQLRALELAAATTENDSGVAVLKLDTSLPLPSLVWAIPHEAVHIAQTCRGDLRHLPGRNSIWEPLRTFGVRPSILGFRHTEIPVTHNTTPQRAA